jgi:thioredoxin reductase (NADPH)
MPNQVQPDCIQTDALVIGAGPTGLFAAFQLGLQEINTHIVDSLHYAGGQCIELYPDKPIYDIPGTPRCTGRELTDSLLKQLKPFKPQFHLGQEIISLEKQADGRFLAQTNASQSFLTKTIFIAAGVGAFQARQIKLEGLERFNQSQIFYRSDANTSFAGQHLLVVGGDALAIQSALHFATDSTQKVASVTLLHRRDVLQAEPELLEKFHAAVAAGSLRFMVGQVTGYSEEKAHLTAAHLTAAHLTAAHITDVDGQTAPLAIDAMLVLLGLSPKLGPIASWGLAMARKQVEVDTEKFSTSEPGIFAIGDINSYPGKKKLILSGFHEATLAVFGAAEIVFPEKKILLQYTTTSPRLLALLGA